MSWKFVAGLLATHAAYIIILEVEVLALVSYLANVVTVFGCLSL